MNNIEKIEIILQDKKYELPLIFNYDLIEELEKLYFEYCEEMKPYLESHNWGKLTSICDGLIKCIKKYYEGFPKKGYEIFEKDIAPLIENDFIFYNKNVLDSHYIDPLKLYRIRKIDSVEEFKREDIFHTPLNKRRYVSSSRYSIAGYPSLYLGTSVDLCRIETGLEKKASGIVSKFRLIRYQGDNRILIRVLDLAIKPSDITPEFKVSFYNKNIFINNYLLIYPLISACSIKVNDKGLPFIPEYIIPQILMQWLRTQQKVNSISGIRYFTTRSKSPRIKGYNYVFPVSVKLDLPTDNRHVFCPILTKCFKLTVPLFADTFENCEYLERQLEHKEIKKIDS